MFPPASRAWATSGSPCSPSAAASASTDWTDWRVLSEGWTPSVESGHHLVGQDPERPMHLLGRQHAAGIQLGHDAVQAEVVPELADPLDQARPGAEGHARLQNVV